MSFTELVPAPSRSSINTGFTPARHSTMLTVLGTPGRLTVNCSPVTNQRLRAMLVTRDMGRFSVTGLRPAVESLTTILSEVQTQEPGLHQILGTAGMLCCRAVRGSTSHFSNHSWGTAIDITVGGILAPLNASRIPQGLLALYPFFHQHGWFWAAGYNVRTDPMHFEVANETILKWRQEGRI